MTEQTQQLNRVAATAKEAILDFIKQRLTASDGTNGAFTADGTNGVFTADQLRFYVNNNVVGGVSPSSADRVLRQLRQSGKLDYAVINRGKSIYRALPLGTTHA